HASSSNRSTRCCDDWHQLEGSGIQPLNVPITATLRVNGAADVEQIGTATSLCDLNRLTGLYPPDTCELPASEHTSCDIGIPKRRWNVVDPVPGEIVFHIAGIRAALNLYGVEVLDTSICIAIKALTNIASGVSQRLAPGVVHIEEQTVGHALFQG